MTITSTIVLEEGELKVEDVSIYPNPYNPRVGDLRISFNVTWEIKLVKVRIYTVGFRVVKQIIKEVENGGRINIIIERRYLERLASGTYYLVLIIKDNEGKDIYSKPQILIIIR